MQRIPLSITVPLLLIASLPVCTTCQEREALIRKEVELVNLFVSVRDQQGRFVPRLTQADFRVFEDGREQEVAYFARESSLPLSLGILLDTSGSQRNLLPAEQEAALRFLAGVLDAQDEALVASFDTEPELLSDITADRAQLERAIRRARIRLPDPASARPHAPPGGTALYDAIYLACQDRLAQRAGRKALVILTDAEDAGSKVTLERALEAAQRADVIVHVILITQRSGFGFGKKNERIAERLAKETGGRVLQAAYATDFDAAFAQIAGELRSQYILGYAPAARARDGRWRKVRIEVRSRGLRAFTRTGYYAPH
jgi:VWFA-related protein